MAQSLLGARSRHPEGNDMVVVSECGGSSERGGGGRGSGGRGSFRGSWAEMLSSTLPTCWNKNVLEVILEKDVPGSFTVGDSDCARVMKKIGLDSRPGVHVEGIQICPNGRGIILITLKKEVPIANFCRHDVIEVTSTIRAINFKPAGKREVIVHMKNIHPNTMDDGVVDYLNKFGKVITKKVIYGMFGEGPLKGLRNGDRSYKMEIKPSINIGTYHVLDGQKVTLRYPGQLQTCARCHETARTCRGKGMARRCEAEGGQKVDLSEYIIKLWKEIGYSPENVEIAEDLDEKDGQDIESGLVQQEGGKFTPAKVLSDGNDKFTGVVLKTFPKDTDECQIVELLLESGLPALNMDAIAIKPNGIVTVKNLENSVCLALISALHNQKHFGRKLFCNGIIPLTPEKVGAESSDSSAAEILGTQPQLPTNLGTTVTSSSAPLGTGAKSSTVPSAASGALNPGAAADSFLAPPSPEAYSVAPSVTPVVSSDTLITTSSPSTTNSCPPFIPCLPGNISLNPPLSSTTVANMQAVVTPTQVHSSPKSSPLALSTVSSYSFSPNFSNHLVSPFSPPNQSLLDIGTNLDIQQFVEDHQLKLSNDELVRRYSLSLRSPPPGTLAADILDAPIAPFSVTPHFAKAKSLLENVKEMTARLSEFESCHSSSEDEPEAANSAKDTDDEGFKTMNQRKKGWKNKRKNSTTPSKDSFMKKLNQNPSPQ